MSDWTPTSTVVPPEGVVIEAMDSGGHVQRLIFEHGLFFFEDRSMHVYYVPAFWRTLPNLSTTEGDD